MRTSSFPADQSSRRLTALLTVLAMSVTALLATALPASAAAAKAYLQKSQYITAAPVDGAQSCQSRNIVLAAGDYRWYQEKSFTTDYGVRRITLAAGSYFWSSCISHDEGMRNGVYNQNSSLTGSNGAANLYGSTFVMTSGTYAWGDVLDPCDPDCPVPTG